MTNEEIRARLTAADKDKIMRLGRAGQPMWLGEEIRRQHEAAGAEDAVLKQVNVYGDASVGFVTASKTPLRILSFEEAQERSFQRLAPRGWGGD